MNFDWSLPQWWAIRDALVVARALLAGTYGLIEGCIELSSRAHYIVPDWTADPDFVIFGVIACETDHLPLGEVRSRWSSTALANADAEIASIIAAKQVKVLKACTNIVARFSMLDQPGGPMEILYRPVGPKELELISASGWHAFPPRFVGQPIFYPVSNEAYAVQIARDWNVKESGAGFVNSESMQTISPNSKNRQ